MHGKALAQVVLHTERDPSAISRRATVRIHRSAAAATSAHIQVVSAPRSPVLAASTARPLIAGIATVPTIARSANANERVEGGPELVRPKEAEESGKGAHPLHDRRLCASVAVRGARGSPGGQNRSQCVRARANRRSSDRPCRVVCALRRASRGAQRAGSTFVMCERGLRGRAGLREVSAAARGALRGAGAQHRPRKRLRAAEATLGEVWVSAVRRCRLLLARGAAKHDAGAGEADTSGGDEASLKTRERQAAVRRGGRRSVLRVGLGVVVGARFGLVLDVVAVVRILRSGSGERRKRGRSGEQRREWRRGGGAT